MDRFEMKEIEPLKINQRCVQCGSQTCRVWESGVCTVVACCFAHAFNAFQKPAMPPTKEKLDSESNTKYRARVLKDLWNAVSRLVDSAEDFQDGFVEADLEDLRIARDSISRLMGKR